MLPARRLRPVRARGGRLALVAALLALVVGCARAPTRPAEIVEPPAATPPAPEPESVPEPEPVPEPEVSLPDSAAVIVPEAQDILVDLDEEQRATLTSNAERDLREAERSIREAELRALSSDNRETLATVEGLLAAAREAFEDQDVQAAATLAHKARLLAAELAAN